MWTLPNILTVGRVAAAPCVALAFVAFERPVADFVALVLFVTASLTDYLDGVLARAWKQESGIGKMLDPVADKAMVTISLAVLLALYGLVWWLVVPVAAILLREVLVSGLREYLGDVKLPVTSLAKWKTTLQMMAIAVLFFAAGAEGRGGMHDTAHMPGVALLWVAAALTAMTGWDYFARGIAYIRAREEG
jgi:CDP-diacylglycerol--glycerol-3-phosphate 3-phosphatidyltransferase